ncbi:MAG TPA: SpoIIE family protein phosphatase [Candidatus Limnocylindrales bacterium]|jgi:sigma-B regulation protein RsbU (phosphoserine phosphatase)|nr:SpoIIE family protein phosphatase [Candidatus Limnocylindrales bacterium]
MEADTDVAIGEPSQNVAESHEPHETERIKVLLIEDNPGDARLIELMLAEAGGDLFEVEFVDRLEAGLRRLTRGDIGLVLLDLSLPDSHGLATFKQLHAAAPRLPIIVLSGLNDTTVAVQAVHEGAQDFLIKGQVDAQLLSRAMRYAIERKRMTEQLGRYAEELRTKNAQLEADFNMAREIQQIFLPHQYPTFPQRVSPEKSALRFSHRYLPAAAVGGDFFDVFALSGTTAGLFICDVMGHGMRAALVTAIMRGLVEELMPVAADAGKFLTEINRSLHAILRRTREPFLATAFYIVADIGNGELRFSSAGHPSPFKVRRDSPTVELLRDYDPRHGPALGLFDKPQYPTCRAPLAENDLILLFTDGLYEVDNADQEEFGQDRLRAAVRRHLHLPTEQLLDAILGDVQAFSTSREFDDDVCLVAMTRQKPA